MPSAAPLRCVLVSHTHWDREWYKTFQSFRARLVDTVDRVLDLVAQDPGYHFQLDGQTIVLEDYLEIRPERRAELKAAIGSGRVAVGPWYVQPDSLIPTGETHVRNLLEGRRVAEPFGRCSGIAYTPDSFGHPAQFPQLFSGFGLGPFIYWRGNGDEIESLPSDYRWRGPDGSEVIACHLARGYFSAWGLPPDLEAATRRLEALARELAEESARGCVLLMNGIDHMPPDPHTEACAAALSRATGWRVERGLLDDYVAELGPASGARVSPKLPLFEGELLGGRVAPLLPGVWSTRSQLKLANRHCEALLQGWAEPWSALGELLGTPSERASLRLAWRELLPNQAHDSICGCSQDRVHEQMETRFDSVADLASETTERLLERIAGLGPERQLTGDERDEISIAVFNPSPEPRTDVVRVALAGFPAFTRHGIAPLLGANAGIEGYRVGDQEARIVPDTGTVRPRLAPNLPVHDLEFVAHDVPAFGWRRFTLQKSTRAEEQIDDGREIAAGPVRLRVQQDGRLEARFGDAVFPDLFGLEDVGDRGDTYDFDLAEGGSVETVETIVTRRRHAGGIQTLEVRRVLSVPARLAEDRSRRGDEQVQLPVTIEARIAPGVESIVLTVRVDNTADDHRLRMLFPSRSENSGAKAHCEAATTFDRVRRDTARPKAEKWVHPAPTTFPQQGWVYVDGLTVAAPGLLEAEVLEGGGVALTLLRATGWLSRPDLESRPGEAGPSLPTPEAQCHGNLSARLALFAGLDPARARQTELGLWSCLAGPDVLAPPDRALVTLSPRELELSALKPAENGNGCVIRILNSGDREHRARIDFADGIVEKITAVQAIGLDERPIEMAIQWNGARLDIDVPPHALRSVLLQY